MDDRLDPAGIRGVARALIDTVGGREAATILNAQYGWDVAILAIAGVEGEGVEGEEVGRAMHWCTALLFIHDR